MHPFYTVDMYFGNYGFTMLIFKLRNRLTHGLHISSPTQPLFHSLLILDFIFITRNYNFISYNGL